MKKFILGLVMGFILCIGISFADDLVSYVAYKANFPIKVNGRDFVSDNPAVAIDGRTYLPLRAMGNALNVKVDWNSEKHQVEVGNVENKPEFEFSNIVVKENHGYTTVQGEVKNNSISEKTMTFKVTFYDKNNKLMGTANGVVNSIKSGEVKTFEAMSGETFAGYGSYKVQVDTSF